LWQGIRYSLKKTALFCCLHLQVNKSNVLKLLSITGTNMYVYGKHQSKKGDKCRIAGKGGEKKIWGMLQCYSARNKT
jgi:hypothetical protein